MDWHKLQHTLFSLDPTDPKEDMEKLKSQAQGSTKSDTSPTKDYVAESNDVPPGSMPVELDSVTDFAALAGIRLDEKQKNADKVRGNEPKPKAKSGRTKHPYQGRLVGEEEIEEGPVDSFNRGRQAYQSGWASPDSAENAIKNKLSPKTSEKTKEKKQSTGGSSMRLAMAFGTSNNTLMNQAIQRMKKGEPLARNHYAPIEEAFKNLLSMDRKQLQKVMAILAQEKSTNSVEEAKKPNQPQERNPHSQDLQALRRSGAMGTHKDKKKQLPRKQKHKNKLANESVKEELFRRLNAKK